LIKRLRTIENKYKLIIATTKDKEDKKIVDLCKKMNVDFFRGSRENVLKRYVKAAEKYNIEIIVRICSDCPFVSTEGIIKMIQIFENDQNLDMIHNKHKNGYPFGTGAEVVRLDALKKAYKEASENYQKEHVLPYIYENDDMFKIQKLNVPENLRIERCYLTVDYPQDLKLIRKIIHSLEGDEKYKIPLSEIINFLKENEELKEINSELHEGYIE